MLRIFKFFNYFFKTRNGINNPNEFIHDISFNPIRSLFIFSFSILIFFVVGFGLLGFIYSNDIALFLSILFLIILIVDIIILIKIKRFFEKISEKVFGHLKKKRNRAIEENNIIDVNHG